MTPPRTFVAYASIGRVYLGANNYQDAILEAKTYHRLQRVVEIKEHVIWDQSDRHSLVDPT